MRSTAIFTTKIFNRVKSPFILSILPLITVIYLIDFASAAKPAEPKNPSSPSKPSDLKVEFKKIKSGDTLISILTQHHFNNDQRAKILQEKIFSEAFTLVPGEKYRVAQNVSVSYMELKFYLRPTDNVLVFWRSHEDSGSLAREEQFNTKIRTAKGKINGSILASINAYVPDDFVAQRFMDAYALDYRLTKEVQRGALFSVTYEEQYDADEFIGCGEVLETSLEINGKIDQRQFVPYSGGGSFIADHRVHKDRPLYSPVDYMRITSHYNPRRLHPITRRRTPHLGVDFELPQGEKIFAAYAGRILRTGKNRAAGRYVVIRHPNGMESYYNHMASIDAKVKRGRYVANGQAIGTVGCSGYCTKPHLHFAVKKRGRFVDPISFLKSYPFRKKALIGQHLAAHALHAKQKTD